MRAAGVLLSFVFPALTFARVGSELDRSPASFADRLLAPPGLPHLSSAFRGDRALVLESVIVFSSIRRLLGGVETIVDPRRGARRALDHSCRTHVLPLPADCAGGGGGGDAIAVRRGAARLSLSRLVRCDRARAPQRRSGVVVDDAWLSSLRQLVRRRRPVLRAAGERPDPISALRRVHRLDRADRVTLRLSVPLFCAFPRRSFDGRIDAAIALAILL